MSEDSCADCDAPCGGKACAMELMEEIEVVAVQAGRVGNGHVRKMHLAEAGGAHNGQGHAHSVPHFTRMNSGSARVEWENRKTGRRGSLTMRPEDYLYIDPDTLHKFTALEPGTQWDCIFMLPTDPGDVVGMFHQERPDV